MKTKFVKIEIRVEKDETFCSTECIFNNGGTYCNLFGEAICIEDENGFILDGDGIPVDGDIRCEQCIEGEI